MRLPRNVGTTVPGQEMKIGILGRLQHALDAEALVNGPPAAPRRTTGRQPCLYFRVLDQQFNPPCADSHTNGAPVTDDHQPATGDGARGDSRNDCIPGASAHAHCADAQMRSDARDLGYRPLLAVMQTPDPAKHVQGGHSSWLAARRRGRVGGPSGSGFGRRQHTARTDDDQPIRTAVVASVLYAAHWALS